jgi:uncharacterized phiE125 gp8 family phage protein
MRPLLISPPAAEPVSLAEAKLYLRLDGDDDNDLVAALIRAARLLVEAASGRQLIAQTWRLVQAEWPRGPLRLPLSPVLALTGAALRDRDGVATPLAGVNGLVAPGHDPPMLLLSAPAAILAPPGAQVELDVTAGFGPAAADVPQPLRQAVLMLAARWFEHRGDRVAGADASLPGDIMALVGPFRRTRL